MFSSFSCSFIKTTKTKKTFEPVTRENSPIEIILIWLPKFVYWFLAVIFHSRIKKYPKKEKKNKTSQQKKEASSTSAKPKKKQKGGSFQDFLPLVKLILEFLGVFRRKLRVNRLEMKLILAADDPCDLAVNYGKAWAALGNLIPVLERNFVIKKRDLEVECDFTAQDTRVLARLDLTITLGRILSLGLRDGIRILREYMRIMNQRKGGAKL